MSTTIVIAGGGTGGHIYPAIAIARALQELDSEVSVHFVGSTQGLEEKLVPKEGYPLHVMKIGKLNYSGGSLGKFKTLLSMPLVFLKCMGLLKKLKPDFVLGVGGFASGPFVATAVVMGYRTAVWEPNAFPGLTNRWLSRMVKTSFVVFDEARKHLLSKEIVQTGLPVRQSLEKLPGPKAPSDDFHILVFGGSQGARAINNTLMEAMKESEWRRGIKFVHQTGKWDYEQVKAAYEGLSGVEVHEFLYDMEQRYAWADLVISRSGASTVAELAACGKASLLIPLPTAADDHQRKNAETLARAGAAGVLVQSEMTPETLKQRILAIKEDELQRRAFSKKIKSFHSPQSALAIGRAILSRC